MSPASSVPLVAHVIHRLATGGLENGLVNLVNHLPPERYRHAIVCLTDATDFARRIRRDDVTIHELHRPPGNSLSVHTTFHRLFGELRPAIVHSRNLGALEAQAAATMARVPVRIHGEHGWDTAHPDGASRRQTYVRRLYAPFVHRYVPLSRQLERYLVDRVRIAPRRVTRICNGVDCDRFGPSSTARGAFPWPAMRDPTLVLVGTVGRLQPVKDQLTLAQAFVAALARRPEARSTLRLVIVGSGPLQPAVEGVLREHGALDLAWMAGERGDVAALLPALDVFVLPSRAEGISNTILEAMACGVPVIATDVGGNPELVSDGESGLLVPPADPPRLADAILALAMRPEHRRTMSAAARERAVAQFSLAEMVRRYAALYDGELARRARPGRGATSAARARADRIPEG